MPRTPLFPLLAALLVAAPVGAAQDLMPLRELTAQEVAINQAEQWVDSSIEEIRGSFTKAERARLLKLERASYASRWDRMDADDAFTASLPRDKQGVYTRYLMSGFYLRDLKSGKATAPTPTPAE